MYRPSEDRSFMSKTEMEENIVSLRNNYSFEVINFIEPKYFIEEKNKNLNIEDICLSKYDFLFIKYTNIVQCFTLNGLFVNSFTTDEPITGFAIDEVTGNLMVSWGKKINKFERCNLKDAIEEEEQQIGIQSVTFSQEYRMLLIIFENNKVICPYIK